MRTAVKVSSLDLKSAYKQMPLHPSDYDKTVVCLKDPGGGGVKRFLMRTLPFGGAASLPHFLRASMLLRALGCHLGLCWAAYFDDFPMASRDATSASSMAAAKALLKFLGFEFSTEKCKPFADEAEVLGVVIDASKSRAAAMSSSLSSKMPSPRAPSRLA